MAKRPFQTGMAFVITERCNLRCRHCLANTGRALSSNGADSDLPSSVLTRWIDAVASARKVRKVSFTGGEPFLAYDTLAEGVSRAAQRGLVVHVLTSAYWASTKQKAKSHLHFLQGLDVLNISVDKFHQEFVPLSRVKNAAKAATELGIRVQIQFRFLKDLEDELEALEKQLDEVVSRKQILSEPVYKLGRAAEELETDQFLECGLDQPCTLANFPLVKADGSIYACCGPTFDDENPLLLGNLYRQSLPEMLEASENNVVLHFLRLWGPLRLHEFLYSEYGETLKQHTFDHTSMCSLCFDLMTNPVTKSLLAEKAQDPKLHRKVATQRFFLLGEATMLARF